MIKLLKLNKVVLKIERCKTKEIQILSVDRQLIQIDKLDDKKLYDQTCTYINRYLTLDDSTKKFYISETDEDCWEDDLLEETDENLLRLNKLILLKDTKKLNQLKKGLLNVLNLAICA